MIRIYTLLALLFSLLSLHAQSFMFKHLEVSDGLSNNSVRCIYKIIIINKIRNFNFYIIGRCSLPAPLKWILLLLRSVPDLRFVIFLKNPNP